MKKVRKSYDTGSLESRRIVMKVKYLNMVSNCEYYFNNEYELIKGTSALLINEFKLKVGGR